MGWVANASREELSQPVPFVPNPYLWHLQQVAPPLHGYLLLFNPGIMMKAASLIYQEDKMEKSIHPLEASKETMGSPCCCYSLKFSMADFQA